MPLKMKKNLDASLA